MNVWLIGKGDSRFIKKYIEHVLLPCGYDIFLVTASGGIYTRYYEENHVTIINTYKLKLEFLNKIPRVRSWARKFAFPFKVKNAPTRDIIHVHFANEEFLYQMDILTQPFSQKIVSFWGSDILRVSEKRRKQLVKRMRNVNSISFITKDMQSRFNSGEIDCKAKQVLADFGNDLLEVIDSLEIELGVEGCKMYLGIPVDKCTIAIGYNGALPQQHLNVIKSLQNLPKAVKRQVFVTFLMSYGVKNPSYYNEVANAAEAAGLDYKIFRDFMDDREMAIYRLSTDIMIHAQQSDAFSDSIKEHLYSGAVLLNPEWIQYDQLVKHSEAFIEYKNFEQLPGILTGIIPQYRRKNIYKKDIMAVASWQSMIPRWLSLYEND